MMPQPHLPPRVLGHSSRRCAPGLAILVIGAIAGCIEPDVTLCSGGIVCPTTSRCDEIHHSCVLPTQLVACAGIADGADCTTGTLAGGCFDGVCLPRGCGNRVIEPDETCDDGNQLSGDGCRGDCRSTEVCGNGFVDPGERCDDGNLISRDGCDSRCQIEDAAWSIVAIAPEQISARTTVYDPGPGRLMHLPPRYGTYVWDGARWTMLDPSSTTLPMAFTYTMFYDPDHQEVRTIGGDDAYSGEPGSSLHAQIYALRQARWVQVSSGDGPRPFEGTLTATYDAARGRPMVIVTSSLGPPSAWTIDATGAWRELPDAPDLAGDPRDPPVDPVMVFDPASAQVLAFVPGREWIYDGDAWTSRTTSFGPNPSVAFDPIRGHLVLVDYTGQAMYERVGTDWTSIDSPVPPCSGWHCEPTNYSAMYYNATAGALEVFGVDATVDRWSETGSWTTIAPAVPLYPAGLTYDPIRRQFVLFQDRVGPDPATELWAWTADRWQRIETAHAPAERSGPFMAYSSGRAATVMYGGVPTCEGSCDPFSDAWTFDGADWTAIESPGSATSFFDYSAVAYDPEQHRVVLAANDQFWGLGDADRTWTQLDIPPAPGLLSHVAWDARNRTMLGTVSSFDYPGVLFSSGVHGWVPLQFAPTALNRSGASSTVLLSDQRSGGVLTIDVAFGAIWERIGADWVQLPDLPIPFNDARVAYNPVDGTVMVAGRSIGGTYAAILSRTGATPLESCRAGDDLDGDGLAGCDDPDCFWACSRCVPYTACR
jgi:cysteine-rich repeat protein